MRNPWDRIVSLYTFIRRSPNHFQHELAKQLSFEAFALYEIAQRPISQYDWLSDANENLLVDTVLKTEELDRTGSAFLSSLLKQDVIVGHLNSSKRPNYREVHTPKSRGAVAECFAKDIEIFDYEY